MDNTVTQPVLLSEGAQAIMIVGPVIAGLVAAVVLVVLRKMALSPENVPVMKINTAISFAVVFVLAYFLAPETTASMKVTLTLAAIGVTSMTHSSGKSVNKWVKKKLKQ